MSQNHIKNTQGLRRDGIKIMAQLIILVRPLLPIMIMAIFLGVIGFLCAIFLTIIAGWGILEGVREIAESGFSIENGLWQQTFNKIIGWLIGLAIMRGILHYGEQYCNHYIAFKLLAIIRQKIFSVLRKLAPAKLEGRDKGNLIAILTSDIELLEVFYAHTISPIAIAILTSLCMIGFIGMYSWVAAVWAMVAYIIIGAMIPIYMGKRGRESGMEFRTTFGELNSFVLDSLRGLDETIQYSCGEQRKQEMDSHSWDLAKMQKKLNHFEAEQRSITNMAILFFSFGMFFLMMYLYKEGMVDASKVIINVIAMMSSFGPVVALSNLSNNLNQTFASGERVLSLLEEKPIVEEMIQKQSLESFMGAKLKNISFSYEEEEILKNYSLEIPKGKIIGLHGQSGSGKSTILKLLMRFWEVDKGEIVISDRKIEEINTKDLRNLESYVTQETYLFHSSIRENIALSRPQASIEEIQEVSKKASIHDFIMQLPKGYDTFVGELGDTLSGGERQRIGIARAFLHQAPLLLLDEPTSNLDSLNEGIILKSLKENCQNQTVVLVSHRASTMSLADIVYKVGGGRLS